MQSIRRLTLLCLILSGTLYAPARTALAQSPPLLSAAQSSTGKLDINTATPAQLKALPGIGDAYAARILKGRPYTAKNQLTQKGILPDAAYARIKDLIIARQVRK